MQTIEKLVTKPELSKRLKVAAYARVSVDFEKSLHSLSTQIEYYRNTIMGNPQWIFVGVYSDEGISGTGIEHRSGFKKLIEDCDGGLIDIILTKSIQRFARNTVDLLKTVRHLKEIGVEVRFEKENISSLSMEGELMLTILASFAQEESRSISENQRWAIQKKFEKGIPHCKFRVYGYRWRGNTLVPVANESAIVKEIYEQYLRGLTMIGIANQLNEEGKKTREGKPWTDAHIRRILKNITYTGNLLLQKQYRSDSFPKRTIINRGEKPMFLIENNHQGIIEESCWKKVQDEIQRRRDRGTFCHPTTFTCKIKCGHCGNNYHRKLNREATIPYWFWTCTGKERKHICANTDVKEDVIKAACAYVLDIESFDETLFEEKVHSLTINGTDSITFLFFDGTEKTIKWNLKDRRRRRDNTPVPIICGSCGALYRRRVYENTDGITKTSWTCSEGCGNRVIKGDELLELYKHVSPAIQEIHVLDVGLAIHHRSGEIEKVMKEVHNG